MRITVSQYAGFCDGVKRAFEMVEQLAADPKTKKPICILGSLVHNQDVANRIASLGVIQITLPKRLEEVFENDSKIGTLVITAHGMGPRIFELAQKHQVAVIDTTCPRVTKVQRLARLFFQRGNQIVVLGEHEHKEVKGIVAWAIGPVQVAETDEEVDQLQLDETKTVSVISQTTQNEDFVIRSIEKIKKIHPKIEVVDTICLTTHQRQQEIKQLAKDNEIVVVIGSPTSANSTRLAEIAQSFNENTYFIERADQLKSEWFSGAKTVAVTAGASAPQWVIDEIIEVMNSLGK